MGRSWEAVIIRTDLTFSRVTPWHLLSFFRTWTFALQHWFFWVLDFYGFLRDRFLGFFFRSGISFFKELDLGVFRCLDLSVFLRMLAYWVSRVWIICFSDLDRFRLLIQSCETAGGFGSFFVRGVVLPDEGEDWPTNGFFASDLLGKIGPRRKTANVWPNGRTGCAGSNKNKAAAEVRGGEFLVRAINDLFQASKGNSDSIFPGSTLAFFYVFQDLDSGSVFRFGFRFGHLVFRTWMVLIG